MKHVLAIAALLMIGCGNNQNNETATKVDNGAQKVSVRMSNGEKLPEIQMITPETAPINIEAVTAEKDPRYLQQKGIRLKDEQ